ncbi:hypothetical protein EG834_15430 [bacterium]|nr:hypothetical protein [bacterium]
MTDQPETPQERSPVPPEEVARRKRQLWLVVGLMVLGFCIIFTLLLGVFWIFGGQISKLVTGT